MIDIRHKTTRRVLRLEITDEETVGFSQIDLEWIGDAIEDVLRKHFDVKVQSVEVVEQDDARGTP
jgi:hypothetical protein